MAFNKNLLPKRTQGNEDKNPVVTPPGNTMSGLVDQTLLNNIDTLSKQGGLAGGNNGTHPISGGNNGQYQSAYSTQLNDLVNKAINRQPFQWDPATDPAYQSYARQYLRLGDESARDTLADVAAATGGLPSSYAVTAAQQARNNYNQALTDKIPALMEAAYDKYRGEYQDALQGIGALQGLDDSAYNRWNADRNYNRSVYESDRDYAMEQKKFEESVRQYNQNYDLDKNSAQFEKMLNMWNALGYANSQIAKYFGIPEGTKTDDAAYRAAQLALQQANSGSSGGSGGRRSSGRRSGGRSGNGGGGGNPAQDFANAVVNNTINDLAVMTASIAGNTDRAKEYLARLGQYMAHGGNTGESQIAAINQLDANKNLTAAEKAWIKLQLGI